MKSLTACLAASFLTTLAAAAPLAATSSITAATVYADRAVVTRTATVQLAGPGVVEVVFDKLPSDLVDESLQVTGRGQAAAQLLEVTARPAFVEFAASDRVRGLEEQLRQLAREDRALSDRSGLLGQQREFIAKIQAATTTRGKDGAMENTPTDTWVRLLSFSDEQITRLQAELQSIDEKRTDLKSRREALEQQLNEPRGQGGRAYKNVIVQLNASSGGSLELTLRYALFAAHWVPSYDARVASADHRVNLGYFGVVRQNTGEDWKGIALTLSTARPSLGGAAPELSPWIVQQEEQITLQPFAISAAPAARAEKVAQAARARAEEQRTELQDMRSAAAQVETQATSATFVIGEKADIPADNAPHKVPIAAIPLNASFKYTTTPKLVPAAFLTSSVPNTSEYPLLAGAMNVFLDDTFVAASSVKTVMPGEKFDLALGADEGIAIKRKLNNRFVEDTGVVTKSKRVTYDITITVQNNKKTAEEVTVQDQIPVSRHEKIVVRVLTPDAKELKPDAQGVLKWNLKLNAGEKRELPLKFSIEHPVDLPVSGME